MSYRVPSDNPVQDALGNDAAAFSNKPVTQSETTAPTLVSIERLNPTQEKTNADTPPSCGA